MFSSVELVQSEVSLCINNQRTKCSSSCPLPVVCWLDWGEWLCWKIRLQNDLIINSSSYHKPGRTTRGLMCCLTLFYVVLVPGRTKIISAAHFRDISDKLFGACYLIWVAKHGRYPQPPNPYHIPKHRPIAAYFSNSTRADYCPHTSSFAWPNRNSASESSCAQTQQEDPA